MVVVQGEPQLFEVIGTLDSRPGGTHLLHRRQEQADQDRDDGDHYQQFDQRETGTRQAILHDFSSRQ
jgi:hypothetical protein